MLQHPRARSVALEGTNEIDGRLPAARAECLAAADLLQRARLAIGEAALDITVTLTQRLRVHIKFLEALLALLGRDATAVGNLLQCFPNAPRVEFELRNVALLAILVDLVQKLLHLPAR